MNTSVFSPIVRGLQNTDSESVSTDYESLITSLGSDSETEQDIEIFTSWVFKIGRNPTYTFNRCSTARETGMNITYSQFSQRSRFGSTEPPSWASVAANQWRNWVPASTERSQPQFLIGLFWCPTRWPRRPESRPLAEQSTAGNVSHSLHILRRGVKL